MEWVFPFEKLEDLAYEPDPPETAREHAKRLADGREIGLLATGPNPKGVGEGPPFEE
jgi:hypothetical protein